MSITVEVSLLSGKRATVQADQNEALETLTQRAQKALRVGKGRLLDSSGVVLDGCTEIRNGDSLTFHVNRGQIQSTNNSFAAILGDGSVVAWGRAACGGDCSAVQGQLKNVQQIRACRRAFAAILSDGSVVTWGDRDHGGDGSAVQGQLKTVQQIQATASAFAAVLEDGSVVTWGDTDRGGDSSAVQGSAKECAADSSLSRCFCCYSWRWICCNLGLLCAWW